MTCSRHLAATTALVSILGATPLAAEVTPADVWADFKRYLEDFGYSVTADEAQDGGALVVTGIAMTMEMPEDAGAISVSLGEMRFEDNGDGSVGVVIPPALPITMNLAVDGEPIEATLSYGTEAFEMNVSGDPDDMTYDYSADRMTLEVTGIEVEGEAVPPDMVTARLEMTGVDGGSTTRTGNLRTLEQEVRAAGMTYDVRIAPPEEGVLAVSGTSGEVISTSTTSMPLEFDMEDIAAMVEAGFAVAGDFTYSDGSSTFSFDEEGAVTQGTSSTTSGTLGFTMGADGLGYRLGADGLKTEMQSAELPFPVSLEAAQMLLDFLVPVSQGEDPQDAAVKLILRDIQVSDMIWMLIDGQQILPRDPATLVIDLSGTVRMMMDLFDPEQMMAMESGEALPAVPESLTINELTVSAAGARIEGEGAVTFDPSDMQTIPGVPRPQGQVNLTAQGVNGLIDRLIRMGVMSEQDAMGGRMMMSMFTVPGEGEDNLRSTIEINEQGHVLANGQRIR